MSPLQEEINKREQMQLKANSRKRKDVCPEQVRVFAMWSKQVGTAEPPAQPLFMGLLWGRCCRGAGTRHGHTRPLLGFAPGFPKRMCSFLRPAASPGASRAVGALWRPACHEQLHCGSADVPETLWFHPCLQHSEIAVYKIISSVAPNDVLMHSLKTWLTILLILNLQILYFCYNCIFKL